MLSLSLDDALTRRNQNKVESKDDHITKEVYWQNMDIGISSQR